MSPPGLEEGNASDISMVDNSLLQCNSDVVVEEERREYGHWCTCQLYGPAPLREMPMWESFKAGDPDDHCSHTS